MNVFGLITLALAASLSPVAITFLMNIMGGRQGLRHGVAYTVGVLTGFSLFSVLMLLGVHGLDLASVDNAWKSDYVIQLLAGLALFFLGVRRLRRRRGVHHEPAHQAHQTNRSSVGYCLFGATTSFTNVTSLAPIAVAMAGLKHMDIPISEGVGLFIGFQLLVLWPLFLVIGLQVVLGERVASAYQALNRGIHRMTGPLMLLLTLGLGGYLTALSLIRLI